MPASISPLGSSTLAPSAFRIARAVSPPPIINMSGRVFSTTCRIPSAKRTTTCSGLEVNAPEQRATAGSAGISSADSSPAGASAIAARWRWSVRWLICADVMGSRDPKANNVFDDSDNDRAGAFAVVSQRARALPRPRAPTAITVDQLACRARSSRSVSVRAS